MSAKLLKLVEDINNFLKVVEYNNIFDGMSKVLAEATEACVMGADNNGRVVMSELSRGPALFNINNDALEARQNERLRMIAKPDADVSPQSLQLKTSEDCVLAVWPVFAAGASGAAGATGSTGVRAGTLALYKYGGSFNSDDMAALGFCAAILAVVVSRMREREDAAQARRVSDVKSAISSLSYSELTAAVHVFGELKQNSGAAGASGATGATGASEGLVIARNIAERTGITRSVIVNALRKLESAGIIESRSLGMKGTYIKVYNDLLIEELDKLRG
jgi:transcriptional pleiotropic repressor